MLGNILKANYSGILGNILKANKWYVVVCLRYHCLSHWFDLT